MSENASQVKLGDLLTRAGLLTVDQLKEGMLIAKQQSIPVGRVLIMAGFITEPNLQAAVQAQSMVKDSLIDLDTVLKGLTLANQKGISLDDALSQTGWKEQAGGLTNKLGELLIDAGLLTKENLDSGLAQSKLAGLPLGRVLVTYGIITEQILAAALNAQILIRDSKISREQALAGLKACRERQISLEDSLKESGLNIPTQENIRLGELLVMAGILTENNMMSVVEVGLLEEKPIGAVLIEKNYLTEPLLQSALAIQKHVAERRLPKADSGTVLTYVAKQGMSVDEAMAQLKPASQTIPQNLPLYQFLQLGGVITAKDIEEALKQGSKDTELMGRMLLLINAVDTTLLDSAVYLNNMIAEGILKVEQAMLALGICHVRKCSCDVAFQVLGWNMSPDNKPMPPDSFAQTFNQPQMQPQAAQPAPTTPTTPAAPAAPVAAPAAMPIAQPEQLPPSQPDFGAPPPEEAAPPKTRKRLTDLIP
ncbi:MAG: hypothetical protein KIT34_17610 [Cyanobacteria bacterium TGS_CYA1]|nr:hypothetical protein [Cyanobacteria bacterium TGS_CYA1]